MEHAHAIIAEEGPVRTADLVEGRLVPSTVGGEAVNDKAGVRVGGIGGSPVYGSGGSVGMLEEHRDGWLPTRFTAIERGKDEVDNRVGKSCGGSEWGAGMQAVV
jgi:hypothetical protein